MMAFIKAKSEDMRAEETFRDKRENNEEQTGGQQMTRSVGGSKRIPQQIKDLHLQDFDEFTSGSSDNYLTESTSESDSDATPNRTKLQLLYDELNDDESDSVCSLDFNNKTSDSMHSLPSKTRKEPISSQNTTDRVVISAHQKGDGSKVNKRHYCLYCSKPYAKIARHLEGSHAHKSDVAKALSFPKCSKERKKLLDHLRKRGNFAHNSAVMKSGKGELVPSKRPAKETQAEDFIHCLYCQGLFRRKTLWRHIRSCRPQSASPKPGKTRVQSMCLYSGPVPSNMTEQLWGIISTMNPGPITDIIKKDKFITEVGQHLLDKGGLSAKNKDYVRGKMRELARLIHNARRVTSLKTMEDCVNPEKYMETVKAVKYTCGFDSETDTFMIPSLANKLGNSLVKVSKLLKARGLTSNDNELVKNASEFQEVHQKKWNETISATALRNMREAQWNMPSFMPFTEDVKKLHLYLNQVHNEWYKSLSEGPSPKAWVELAKVCLAQIILLNRQRGGEVPSMPLSAYLSRGNCDPHREVDWALSEVEKKFCGCFSRIIVSGKHGRPVPILLTLKMLCALELLVRQREACGVLKDNAYIFARPEAMTHFRGTNCLRSFARSCGAKCPKALTSTRLRKHVATLSTVLNMTDTEMEHLANFLECDTRINSDICRLPEKTQQLAQIGKALIAFEQGRLPEFGGKILDEIGMESDEKVLECDEEHRIPLTSGCSSQQVQEVHAFTQNSPSPPAPTGLHPFQIPVDDEKIPKTVSRSNNFPQQMKDTDLQDFDDDDDGDFTSGTTSESDSDACFTPKTMKLQLLYDNDNNDNDEESGSVSSLDFENKTSDNMNSLASQTGETEEEPISSQNTTDRVVISAHQKGDGSKVNKRHYCLYCSKPYAKIARHLEGSHSKKSDVAKALSFPKCSKERKKLLDHIRKRGNYAHNSAVMKSGKGELVPSKRPAKETQAEDFIHCLYCQGLFRRKTLWRHIRSCRPQSASPKPGKTRVQSMCLYSGPVPSNMTEQLWGIISTMNPGPITDIIKKDKFITEVGQHLLDKGGLSAKNKECVRGKMRELARLIHNARRVTSLKTMEDCVNPEKYMETVKAVKYTCGFDSETDTFMIPSLANKLGNSLVKVSKLLKARGLTSNDNELVKNASEFQEVHQKKWNETISATALRNMREAQWNMPSFMPFTEDVKKLHLYLNQVHDEWYKSLSEGPSPKAWVELAKVCLAQIILLNRQRGGEVPSMPLSAYLSRGNCDPHREVDWALSEVEKKFCGCFSRIIVSGKHGRPVPILLTLKMLCALELLVRQREACGVLKDNAYIFARPEAMTHFRGTNCLRSFARSCGAKCPKALTSTRLRKHVATLSTVLNMTDTEMEHLANFFECDTRINSDICRLPEKTQQLAQIGKALIAFEQGRLPEFGGKILDEIGMESDEKVLECDEEHRIPLTSGCSSQQVQEVHAFTQNSRELCPLPSPPAPTGLHLFQKPVVKSSVKRNPWQQSEVQAVERHMKGFIISCTVPAKSDCEKCLQAEPDALRNRDWRNVKFFIYNRITAYKRSANFLKLPNSGMTV